MDGGRPGARHTQDQDAPRCEHEDPYGMANLEFSGLSTGPW